MKRIIKQGGEEHFEPFCADLYFPAGEENRELITDCDSQFKLQYIRVVYCQDGSIMKMELRQLVGH